MVNCVKGYLADEINGKMWDTSLVLKFQPMKSYFGRTRGLREIYHLFNPFCTKPLVPTLYTKPKGGLSARPPCYLKNRCPYELENL